MGLGKAGSFHYENCRLFFVYSNSILCLQFCLFGGNFGFGFFDDGGEFGFAFFPGGGIDILADPFAVGIDGRVFPFPEVVI